MVSRQTSLWAHIENKEDGRYLIQKERIIAALQEFPDGLTRAEIQQVCGIHIPAVCGRVKELLTQEPPKVYENENVRRRNASGKSALIVRLVGM